MSQASNAGASRQDASATATSSGSRQAWASDDEGGRDAPEIRIGPPPSLWSSRQTEQQSKQRSTQRSTRPKDMATSLSSFQVLTRGGTLQLSDVHRWGPVMLPIFVSSVTILAVACLFLILGPGEGDFVWSLRPDVIFISVLLATAMFGMGHSALHWCAHYRNVQDLPWARWFRSVVRYLEVNAVTSVLLILLAHATVVLAQILSVLAATCWTIFCMNLTVWAWRWGVKAPAHGDPPLMLWLRKACPTVLIFVVFIISVGLALLVLFVQPAEDAGLDPTITRMEHWLLLCLGALPISATLWTFALVLWRPFRRLLVFRYLAEQRAYEEAPSLGHATWRAAMLSFAVHCFGAAFVAFLWYGLITLVVILLTQAALWGARRHTQDNMTKWTNLGRASLSSEDDSSPRSPRDFGSIEDGNPEQRHKMRSAAARARLERRRQEETLLGQVKTHIADVGLVLFGMVKVAALFVVFLFDVTFIQKYVSSTVTRTFVRVSDNQVCGSPLGIAEARLLDPESCARLAIERGASGFAYGTSIATSEQCWPYDLQFELSRSEYSDLVSGSSVAACSDANGAFDAMSGIQFYFIEPERKCDPLTDSVRRQLLDPLEETARRLQDEGDAYNNDFQSNFNAPNEMGAATRDIWSGIGMDGFGRFCQRTIDFFTSVSKSMLRLTPDVPGAFSLRCTGLRRLAAALILLGCVGAVGAIASLDVMSVVQASKQLALARGAGHGSFLQYTLLLGFETGLEQCILLLLQVTISSASTVKQEAVGVWKQECGVFVDEQNFAGGDCPNIWHIPIDAFATVLVYLALFGALVIIIAVFSGSFYGLAPARWAILTLFGKDFHLSQFGGHDATMARAPAVVLEGGRGKTWQKVAQPFMGLPVSLGVWTTWTSKGFQIGRRQDWYQPIEIGEGGYEEELGETDLVNWKCMYASTAKQISLAWLPLPYVGGIMAKGVLYLNENVVFAFGQDGGGTKGEQEPIRRHLQEDRPTALHGLHWATHAAQFLIVLLINYDFFGMERSKRLPTLAVCMVAVLAFAVLRVVLDTIETLLVFVQADKLLHAVADVVVHGDVEEVAAHAKEGGGRDPLKGLNHEERARVAQACADLLELQWVQDRVLPVVQRNHLTSDRIRTKNMAKVVLLMQRAALHKRDPLKGADVLIKAASLLLLRDLSDSELQSKRADRSAKAELRRVLRTSLEAAVDTDNSELCKVAKERAKVEVSIEAKKWCEAYAKALQECSDNLRNGIFTEKPPAPPKWIRLSFLASAELTVSVKGMWKVNSQVLAAPQEGHAVLYISGEVELRWPANNDLSLLEPDKAVVTNCEVELDVRKPRRFPDPSWSREDLVPRPSEQPLAIVDEEMGPTLSRSLQHYEKKAKQDQQRLFLACCRKSAGDGSASLEEGDSSGGHGLEEQWALHTSGPTWQAPTSRLDGEVLGPERTGAQHIELRWHGQVLTQDITHDRVEQLVLTPEVLTRLEGMVQAAPQSAEWLLDNFFSAIGGPALHELSAAQAAKREQLLLEVARMMTRKRRGEGGGQQTRKTDSAVQRRIYALEYLRMQLAKDPQDEDDLGLAVDMGHRAGVDRSLLAKGEELLLQLKKRKKNTALGLEAGTDEAERDAMAESALQLEAAAMDKTWATSKRRAALLKLAVATDNAQLIQRAIDEELAHGDDANRSEVDIARERLDILRYLPDDETIEADLASGDASQLRRKGQKRLGTPAPSSHPGYNEEFRNSAPSTAASVARPARNHSPDTKLFRASAALRAAAYQDPVNTDVLRLALDQAAQAGVEEPLLAEAQGVLDAASQEAAQMESLRTACSASDVAQFHQALAKCKASAVNPHALLTAIAGMIEECAKQARHDGNAGEDNSVLTELEAERVLLHQRLQDSATGVRAVCRLKQEQLESKSEEYKVRRIDRCTLAVRSADGEEQQFKSHTVFGQQCIQAEVFSDVRGLVESVLYGKNVCLLACGAKGSGKSFTMLGGTAEGRGVVPRALEEIFTLRERDAWRYHCEVHLQAFEIFDASGLVDMLSRPSNLSGTLRRRLQVSGLSSGAEVVQAPGMVLAESGFANGGPSLPYVVGSIHRPVNSKHEALAVVQEASSNLAVGDWSPHLLFIVDMCRINRATGVRSGSRLILGDLAGLDGSAPAPIRASYDCLQAVLSAAAAKQPSVPFASHPLTQILEGCVGGSAQVVLLLPVTSSFEGSLNTLDFGIRAGGVSVCSQRPAM